MDARAWSGEPEDWPSVAEHPRELDLRDATMHGLACRAQLDLYLWTGASWFLDQAVEYAQRAASAYHAATPDWQPAAREKVA